MATTIIADTPTACSITPATPIEQIPEYLRVEEVAAYLRVGRGVVYDAIRSGSMPCLRVGRLVRVPRSALAERAE